MTEARVREISGQDWACITALDASYETEQRFQAQWGQDGALRLSPQLLSERQYCDFHIDLSADAWTRGWLIELGGEPKGFIATQHLPWNQRLTVWHFYVDRSHRRCGFGRRLMDCALTNEPGIAAYRRLGFEICGFDHSLYHGTARSSEFAVFLWKRLSAQDH